MQLQWTSGWFKGTRWAKHDDVLQNANYISTGSSPMAQETRPHGATMLPSVLGDRAAAWMRDFYDYFHPSTGTVFGTEWERLGSEHVVY